MQHIATLVSARQRIRLKKKRERSNWLEAALLLALRRLPHIILGINSTMSEFATARIASCQLFAHINHFVNVNI
jgi:hypothetical protein